MPASLVSRSQTAWLRETPVLGGTLFTGEFCPRGTISPVNNVWGDILGGL